MKYLIASDLHGSEYCVELLVERYHEEKPDKILLLGDLLYHGPRNDLPEKYDTKSVMSMLNELKDEIICVRGNCDAEVDQMVLEFPIMDTHREIPHMGKTIWLSHGHRYNISTPPLMDKGDILLHGHTHIPAWQPFGDENMYLNPGSVSIPKAGSGNSYMTLEDGLFQWKYLSGEVYHEYMM